MILDKKSHRNSWLPILTIGISAAVACFSLYMIVSTLANGRQEQSAFDELTAIVEKEKPGIQMQEPEEIVSAFTEVTTESESNLAILPEYATVYEQNCDLYGWLRIDDTPINYPVMYTPDDSQYYLRRAFDKKDAKSALSFLESSECDAAFIDIKMPIVNGVDLAKQIEEKYPDMKIVFITGLGSEDIHQQYEAALERKIILKPIAAEQLQTIANSLNSQEKECW